MVVIPEATFATQRRKRRSIPDIATWIEVYSTYMLVLGSAYPSQFPELVAYQLLIVRHSKSFKYPSWLCYDTEFRRWAASHSYHTWSQIHPQFYALAFTSQGQWCPICYSDGGNHSYDCPEFAYQRQRYPTNLPPPNSPTPQRSLPSQRPAPSSANYESRFPPAKRLSPDHCILYNKYNGNCPYGFQCTKTHMCAPGGTPYLAALIDADNQSYTFQPCTELTADHLLLLATITQYSLISLPSSIIVLINYYVIGYYMFVNMPLPFAHTP